MLVRARPAGKLWNARAPVGLILSTAKRMAKRDAARVRKSDSAAANNDDNTAVGQNRRKVLNSHNISQIRICGNHSIDALIDVLTTALSPDLQTAASPPPQSSSRSALIEALAARVIDQFAGMRPDNGPKPGTAPKQLPEGA